MKGGEEKMHFGQHFKDFKDLKIKMENKGEDLIITLHGNKEKVAAVEKKLKALHELCGEGCCDGDDNCCC